jgi:hypothetical protein
VIAVHNCYQHKKRSYALLSQVAGFFVIESYVQRVTDGLVGPAEGAALWAGAQRSLKATLEAAFEQLGTASLMLMVKDFVLLVCVALERAGYQVRDGCGVQGWLRTVHGTDC